MHVKDQIKIAVCVQKHDNLSEKEKSRLIRLIKKCKITNFYKNNK